MGRYRYLGSVKLVGRVSGVWWTRTGEIMSIAYSCCGVPMGVTTSLLTLVPSHNITLA
jgi:hypothetical protein